MEEPKSFGQIVQEKRKENGWNVKDFIEKLGVVSKEGRMISAPYITRIEVHGEIPTPEVIIRIAEVLNCNEEDMLKIARDNKVKTISQTLKRKYATAYGLYRKSKGGKNE